MVDGFDMVKTGILAKLNDKCRFKYGIIGDNSSFGAGMVGGSFQYIALFTGVVGRMGTLAWKTKIASCFIFCERLL